MLKRFLPLLLLAFPAPAFAANCNSFPFTLVNGQIADANQVMANFNNLLNCANTNLAHNGANSDITALTGLTTPLSVGQGGTGSNAVPSIVGQIMAWTGTVWGAGQAPAVHCTMQGVTSPGNAVVTKVPISSCTINTVSGSVTTASTWIPPSGTYQFNATVYASSVSSAGELQCWIGKNGNSNSSTGIVASSGTVAANNSSNLGCHTSGIATASGSDTFELDMEFSNTTSGSVSATFSFLDGIRVSN